MNGYIIGIIIVVAVAGLGAWLKWSTTSVLAALKIGFVVGRMQQRRRDGDMRPWDDIYADVEEGTLAS